MLNQSILQRRWAHLAFLIVIIGALLGIVALLPLRETVQGWFSGKIQAAEPKRDFQQDELELIEVQGNQGLRLPAAAVAALRLQPAEALTTTEARPLPPQIGTLNYDNDRLFTIRSRFPGELADVGKVMDTDGPVTPTRQRPLRFGDKVNRATCWPLYGASS
jgi:hypothetical protein